MAKILIINGSKEESRELSLFLQNWGEQPVLAGSKKEGVSVLEGSSYDVVFVDENILVENALETMEVFYSVTKGGVLAVTINRRNSGLFHSLNQGGRKIAFIQKPCETADIVFFIEQALSSKGSNLINVTTAPLLTKAVREEARRKRYDILLKERLANL